MRIKSPKDFWAGLMFIGFGLFFVVWAWTHYQMGSAVRMGPAYFPTLLGGLLAFLGMLVLIEAFALADSGEKLKLPFNIVDLAIGIGIYVVAGLIAPVTNNSRGPTLLPAAGVVVPPASPLLPPAHAARLLSPGCAV